MDTKVFAIVVFSVVVVACLAQALYPPEKLGRIVVRTIAAYPRPVRRKLRSRMRCAGRFRHKLHSTNMTMRRR